MKRKLIKTISMIAVLSMMGTNLAFAAAIPADVTGSTYETAVTALIEDGAITGDSDGLFHPEASLTRAQACTIIVRAMEPPSAEVVGTTTQSVPASGFPDMSGAKWAEGYIGYAVKHGIVTGYPDGTFRPGHPVSSNEMLTMVLRACGYTAEQIGTNWPTDYITKAAEEGITAGIEELPETATKEIAAQMVYNQLNLLKEKGTSVATQDPKPEDRVNDDSDDDTDGLTGFVYGTGKFNANMTTYAGTSIDPNVQVYTFGLQSQYKSSMVLPEKEGDLRKDTVHKFKLADTPAFYKLEGGKITEMILPMDAGFSGRIYGVINSSSKTTNGNGDQVNNIYTLVAGQKVAWLTKENSIGAPSSYLKGEVYELVADKGTIKRISGTSDDEKNANFLELTSSGGWDNDDNKVVKFSDDVVTLESGEMFEVTENATVYVISDDGKSYNIGKRSDIKTDAFVRLYSISEDEETAAIVTVKKK